MAPPAGFVAGASPPPKCVPATCVSRRRSRSSAMELFTGAATRPTPERARCCASTDIDGSQPATSKRVAAFSSPSRWTIDRAGSASSPSAGGSHSGAGDTGTATSRFPTRHSATGLPAKASPEPTTSAFTGRGTSGVPASRRNSSSTVTSRARPRRSATAVLGT